MISLRCSRAQLKELTIIVFFCVSIENDIEGDWSQMKKNERWSQMMKFHRSTTCCTLPYCMTSKYFRSKNQCSCHNIALFTLRRNSSSCVCGRECVFFLPKLYNYFSPKFCNNPHAFVCIVCCTDYNSLARYFILNPSKLQHSTWCFSFGKQKAHYTMLIFSDYSHIHRKAFHLIAIESVRFDVDNGVPAMAVCTIIITNY